jgi:hypothetical protein
MRIMAKMAILALAARACYPEERQDGKRSITVFVDSRAEVTDERLSDAEFMASRMFEQVGVFVRWRRGPSKGHDIEQIITGAITSNTPRNFHPGALAYAEVYPGQFKDAHIRIFFDRVESSVAMFPRSSPLVRKLTASLLGHVLVHEITHILEASDHHSEEGVMKKHWTINDLFHMEYRPLPFDLVDVELIRRGLADRGRAATSAQLGNRGVAELALAQ